MATGSYAKKTKWFSLIVLFFFLIPYISFKISGFSMNNRSAWPSCNLLSCSSNNLTCYPAVFEMFVNELHSLALIPELSWWMLVIPAVMSLIPVQPTEREAKHTVQSGWWCQTKFNQVSTSCNCKGLWRCMASYWYVCSLCGYQYNIWEFHSLHVYNLAQLF